MNIWPKSLPATIPSRFEILLISSLSNTSSSSSIGGKPYLRFISSYWANFKETRNDFCCPCEPQRLIGKPFISKRKSSL